MYYVLQACVCISYPANHDKQLFWQNCTTPPNHWDFGIWLGWMSISWDPSQLHAIPNPDHLPPGICLTYQSFCTKKKSSVSFQIENWDLMIIFDNFNTILQSRFNYEFGIILLSESESFVSVSFGIVFSYASSSTLYPRQRVSKSVIVSDCNLLA